MASRGGGGGGGKQATMDDVLLEKENMRDFDGNVVTKK